MTNTQIVSDILQHSDSGDFARFRALLADDCEWVNPVVRARGADEISRNVAGFFAAFPHRQHQVALTVESGETVAIEGRWVATHDSGRPVEAPFAAIMQVRAGHVAAVRLYLDTAALLAQIDTGPHVGRGEVEVTQDVRRQNKDLYCRWFTDVVSRGDMAAAEELLSGDYRLHFPGFPEPVDREGHKGLVTLFRSGFPDWVETIEDVVAEGDRVVARIRGQGTHLGEFQGVEATRRQVSATGIGIARIADGRIVEAWAAYDAQGLLEQLRAPHRAAA
jgi:ketosteroid isomerase-like protein